MNTHENTENEILSGFRTASIDHTYHSSVSWQPEFLSNDPSKGKKVLVSLEKELSHCDSFKISVAFITLSGITPLLQVFKELEEKKIRGQILTTNYLSFTDPKALEKLSQFHNLEVRMLCTNEETGGFHTKGYIFQKGEIYHIIIGSSNMTLTAVTKNREWNTKFVTTLHGEMTQQILEAFDTLWNDPNTKCMEACLEEYRETFCREKQLRDAQKARYQVYTQRFLKPNAMQEAFVNNVVEMRNKNIHKALLLSATGTGKTYASAFAMKKLAPKRLLFVVHREQIARQSMQSYKRVFGNARTYGLLSGNQKDMDVDFLFATMQMLSKEEIYTQFSPTDFEVIILDECHHAGAASYQKIMQYFQPAFWLGMTASPDTTNYDIYSLFDHHIAYEIRLQQALEENLLCPFHYFGITDLFVNGDGHEEQLKIFSNLVCEERVGYILQNAEYYGYSGNRVKGLIFCSRKDEARELSDKFNTHQKPNGQYYRTCVLTGSASQEERQKVVEQLVSDTSEDTLDYVFTVDIFNEGVDIPEINQVIMLRPTKSPVVFVQQLGRGLRKYKNKEYVVILDFIGNYTNNYMIPIALSGDRTYNKDTMRRYVMEGARIIPGSSTIHFDEISKKRIFASIDCARTNDMKLLKDSYTTLKYKLGRIPTIQDYQQYGAIDVMKIFEKCGSYYAFLKKVEPNYTVQCNASETMILEFLSKKVVSFKRNYETELLKELICQEKTSVVLRHNLSCRIIDSIERNLMNLFAKEDERKKYAVCDLIVKENGQYALSAHFKKLLEHDAFRNMVLEVLTFSEQRNQAYYSHTYRDTDFCLYQKYTYEDVCRLLGWQRNMNAQNIGGYFYDKETKTLPVFINYDKSEDAIAYEDRFISESELIALSKHPRKITSSDAQHIYKMCEEDKENRIFLFVRKNKDDKETKEFYFLGEIFAEGKPKEIYMPSTKDNAFEIQYRLDVPVRSDIYDYLING